MFAEASILGHVNPESQQSSGGDPGLRELVAG
jgi:hypothetical protein